MTDYRKARLKKENVIEELNKQITSYAMKVFKLHCEIQYDKGEAEKGFDWSDFKDYYAILCVTNPSSKRWQAWVDIEIEGYPVNKQFIDVQNGSSNRSVLNKVIKELGKREKFLQAQLKKMKEAKEKSPDTLLPVFVEFDGVVYKKTMLTKKPKEIVQVVMSDEI